MVLNVDALCFIVFLWLYLLSFQYYASCTQDQTSSRPNTLSDDADDIQRQLDNEAHDRLLYGRISSKSRHKGQRRKTKSPKKVKSGQNEWPTKYPACAGSLQSPVDLPGEGYPGEQPVKMQYFNHDMAPNLMKLESDGQRVVMTGIWGSRHPYIHEGSIFRKYWFHSLVLHWPSEHKVAGQQFPIESQALYVSSQYDDFRSAQFAASNDSQAMLGIVSMYRNSTITDPGLNIILRAATLNWENKTALCQPLEYFIPPLLSYVRYQGSLTVPPCTESVLWLVRSELLTVSNENIELANTIVSTSWEPITSHNRALQALRGRDVCMFKNTNVGHELTSKRDPRHAIPYFSRLGNNVLLNCYSLLAEQISRLRASQSPIAISLQKCPTWTSLDALKFRGYWDNEGSGVLLNTGQTAYFTLDSAQRPRLSGGPLLGEYIFEQMHFHWSVDDFTGCEHVLDGHGYAAECHFVHYNSKYSSIEAAVGHADGLAVVGFLLEAVDAPNPLFDTLVEALDSIQKRDTTALVTAESLAWMDRDDLREGSYVTYKGSLTTPPYTECVTWIIYEKPVTIGTEQLGLLRALEGQDSKPIERNVRPTQRHPPGHSVIYVKQVKSKL